MEKTILKLIFDHDFKDCFMFNESKHSMPWVSCAFCNVYSKRIIKMEDSFHYSGFVRSYSFRYIILSFQPGETPKPNYFLSFLE